MAKNTPKQPEKISADCPHCGFSQLESAFAKTTFCRKCGEHFSIEKLLLKEADSLKGPSLLDRFSKLLSRETSKDISCFSCGHKQTVTSVTQSTLCPACGSYIDLRDFKIAGPFGRSIQTQGEVVITSKGDVTSSRIACRDGYIEGKVRGTVLSTGVLHIKIHGKFPGTIDAEHLVVEKKSEVDFVRPLKVRRAEINGRAFAQILCDGCVVINKGGYLEGTVHARSITVEKGGIFSGELFIGLPEEEAAQEEPAAPKAGEKPSAKPAGGGGVPGAPAKGQGGAGGAGAAKGPGKKTP